jgi:glycosyltransferase involved in cell wall biosynthesis
MAMAQTLRGGRVNTRISPSQKTDSLQQFRVLVYTTQARFPGGFENLAVDLAEELSKSGVWVAMLSHYALDFEINGFSCGPRALPEGLTILSLNERPRSSIWSRLKAMLKLRGYVRDLRVKAIEVSGTGPSLLASFATIGMGVRVLVGIHHVMGAEHRASLFRWAWRAVSTACKHVTFFGVSDAASRAWIRYSGCAPDRIITVHNAINQRFFAECASRVGMLRTELSCSKSERIILCAGRIMPLKAQDVVIEAIAPLLKKHQLRLVLVGRADCDGGEDSGFLNRIKRMASESGSSRIHFLGARHDMREIMSDADLLVHVPRGEAFGLVIAEALATGIPVIASRVGGIPEVLAETDSILVPEGDAHVLRQAVQDWASWPSERRVSSRAKAQARARAFHPEERCRRILELLQVSHTRTHDGDH